MIQGNEKHPMCRSIIHWEIAIIALNQLFIDQPKEDNIYTQLSYDQYLIQSLYHLKFVKILGDRSIKFYIMKVPELIESLKELDFLSPIQFNLGRNSCTDVVFTGDYKYSLKTITASEFYHFKNRLYKGFFGLMKNSSTLIARVYGMYSIQKITTSKDDPKHTRIFFVIMENLFLNQKVAMVFDLKGATFNRSLENFQDNFMKQEGLVKGKDTDFMILHERSLNPLMLLPMVQRSQLLEALQMECAILKDANVMDYSVLLIVCNEGDKNAKGWKKLQLTDGRSVCLGVIDFLQEYNTSKVMERQLKQLFGLFKRKRDISCINSEQYYDRIIAFFKKILMI